MKAILIIKKIEGSGVSQADKGRRLFIRRVAIAVDMVLRVAGIEKFKKQETDVVERAKVGRVSRLS